MPRALDLLDDVVQVRHGAAEHALEVFAGCWRRRRAAGRSARRVDVVELEARADAVEDVGILFRRQAGEGVRCRRRRRLPRRGLRRPRWRVGSGVGIDGRRRQSATRAGSTWRPGLAGARCAGAGRLRRRRSAGRAGAAGGHDGTGRLPVSLSMGGVAQPVRAAAIRNKWRQDAPVRESDQSIHTPMGDSCRYRFRQYDGTSSSGAVFKP